ncbi:MAG: class I SAM-dependent methyltransferase [Candidatus Fimenecus sp.]
MDKKESMTALTSLFARAWHNEEYAVQVLEDSVSRKLLTDEEYEGIGMHMAGGISFFNPQVEGTPKQALSYIAEEYLCPSVLSRGAFSEDSLCNAAKFGASQYLILGSGYDTFAYRQPPYAESLKIFELDRENMIQDKIARLARGGITPPENVRYIAADLTENGWEKALLQNPDFNGSANTFCSLLGLVYYLTTAEFVKLLRTMSGFLCEGSTLVFDYPNKSRDLRAEKQTLLARGADEPMYGRYSEKELICLLSDCGFRVYEHLTPTETTSRFFTLYNRANPQNPLNAFENTSLCLAVRK